jgi:hypothetical protein
MKYLKPFFENNEEIDYLEKYGLYPEDIKDMFYDLEEKDCYINVKFTEKLITKSSDYSNLKFDLEPYISVNIGKKNYQNMSQRMVEFDLEQLVDSDEFNDIINTSNLRLKDYGWKINHIRKELDHINISICKINI